MAQSGGEGGSGYGVKLGLFLDATNFNSAIAQATEALTALESRKPSVIKVKTQVGSETIGSQLEAIENTFNNTASISVGTHFAKAGGSFAIGVDSLKRDIIRPVQKLIDRDAECAISIRTVFEIDPAALEQVKNSVASAARNVGRNVNQRQSPVNQPPPRVNQYSGGLTGISGGRIDSNNVRKNFAFQVGNTPSAGGMNDREIQHLTKALKALGVQINSTNTAGLRSELQSLFRDASKLGDEVLQGLVKGAQTGKFYDVGLKGAKNFLSGAQDALGIASPSKEFKKIGFWSAVGIGIGFAQEMARQERAMARSLRQTISRVFRLAGLREEIRQLTASMGDAKSTDNPQRLIQAIERYRRIAASLGETPRLTAAPTQRMGKPSVDVREKGKFVSQRSALTTINNDLNRSIKQYLPTYGQIIAQLVPLERDLARLTRKGFIRGVEAIAPVAESLGRAVVRGVVRGLDEAVPIINRMAADARKALHEATRAKGGPITTDRASLALGAYQARRRGALVDQSIQTVTVRQLQNRIGGSTPAGLLRDRNPIVRSPGGRAVDQTVYPVNVKEIVPPPRNRNLRTGTTFGYLGTETDASRRTWDGKPLTRTVNPAEAGVPSDVLAKKLNAALSALFRVIKQGLDLFNAKDLQSAPRGIAGYLPGSRTMFDPNSGAFYRSARTPRYYSKTNIAGYLPGEGTPQFDPNSGAFYRPVRSANVYSGLGVGRTPAEGMFRRTVDLQTEEKGLHDVDPSYLGTRKTFDRQSGRTREVIDTIGMYSRVAGPDDFPVDPPGALSFPRTNVNPYSIFDNLEKQVNKRRTHLAGLNSTFSRLGVVNQWDIEQRRSGLNRSYAAAQKFSYNPKEQAAGKAARDAEDAGRQVAAGIASGMNNQGATNKAAKSYADSLIQALKKIFRIHSPSDLTRQEIGKPSGAGITEGIIEDIQSDAQAIANTLTRVLRAAMRRAMSALNGGDSVPLSVLRAQERALRNAKQPEVKAPYFGARDLNSRGQIALPGTTHFGYDYYPMNRPSSGFKPIAGQARPSMGDEMGRMMRGFKHQIANLTLHPDIYRQMLMGLPDSYITTDMAGLANKRKSMSAHMGNTTGKQWDFFRMLPGSDDLEQVIRNAYANYQKSMRAPDPWYGSSGSGWQALGRGVGSGSRAPMALPGNRFPTDQFYRMPATSMLADMFYQQLGRTNAAYKRRSVFGTATQAAGATGGFSGGPGNTFVNDWTVDATATSVGSQKTRTQQARNAAANAANAAASWWKDVTSSVADMFSRRAKQSSSSTASAAAASFGGTSSGTSTKSSRSGFGTATQTSGATGGLGGDPGNQFVNDWTVDATATSAGSQRTRTQQAKTAAYTAAGWWQSATNAAQNWWKAATGAAKATAQTTQNTTQAAQSTAQTAQAAAQTASQAAQQASQAAQAAQAAAGGGGGSAGGGGGGPVPPAPGPVPPAGGGPIPLRNLYGQMRINAYGYRRSMLDMENQSAETQTIAQAFQNLGGESLTAHNLLRRQRNLDVEYINASTPYGSREQRMGNNLRDIQEMQYVNDVVRQGQANSGFGGFRGREIGNDTLNKSLQLTDLKNQMIKLEEVAATYERTSRNSKTYARTTAALAEEYKRMDVAARVLESSLTGVNDNVTQGEKVAHIARNAWGTILDDFENLVPQLLVFAVAYNLLLQRVMGTPAAVIQAAGAFDRLDTSISSYLSATRGMGDASAELAKVRQIALDTGIGYESAADSYLKFAASTQGTPLQGQEADITRTLANAGRNQGLSGEQVNRSIVALTQILSKGRVQAEELRGQLAEQLPGAIQVAARAYGVSTKELYRMVEAGQLAGDEFVGKFINQLSAEGANVNQLAGSFSNVTEQFGSTMQMFSASAGQPYLEPLTSGLQALNALMTTLIPAAGLLGSVFLATGSRIAKGALGISSWRQAASDLVKEQFDKQNTSTILLDKNGNPLSTKAPNTDKGRLAAGLQQAAEGARQLGANLNPAQKASVTIAQSAEKIGSGLKTAGTAAWNMSGGLRETLVSALKFYVVMEGISTILKFAKGELGSLGDEVKKLDGMDKFGSDQKNNRPKIELNPFALIARSVTIADAVKIAGDARETTGNIIDNTKPIEASLRQLDTVERQLFDARMQRERLSRGGTQQEIEDNRKLIEQLEKRRKLIQDLLPNVQGRLTVIDSALQAMKEVEQNDPSARGKIAASAAIKELERERAALVAAATRRGLLGRQLPRYKTLAAIEGDRTAAVASMQNNPLDSTLYRDAQKIAVGAQKLGADSQLLPQEQELQTLDLLMKSLTAEQQKQETIARIRLGTIENERKAIEAALSLEQTRNRLRQVIANGKVQIASELGVPEQRLAAERAERLESQAGQKRELAIQSQLIAKDKERIGIETNLQKQQIELDKVQLEITVKQLEVEKLKIVLAMQNWNVTKEQEAIYKKQIQYLDQAIGSTKEGLKNQGNMNALLDQTAAAQRDALEIKEQELATQLQIVDATGANAAKLEEIKAAKQDIENRERAALDKVAELNKAIEEQNALYQDRAETIRATIEAEKQRAQDAQDSLRTEADLITRMLDAYTSRREGGFFERQNKAQLLEGTGEQQAYQLAERRYQLLQKIQQEQNRMKLLDLTLKEKELEIEEEMYKLKILGLKAANEESRIQLRDKMESLVMTVDKLGSAATPDQIASAARARQLLTGFGYNPSVGGNSLTISETGLTSLVQAQLASESNVNAIEANASSLFAGKRAALADSRAASMGIIDTQTRLADFDAKAQFAQFLDQATATGRVLTELAGGLSEFRQSVASAFSEGLFNGDAKEGLVNAGETLGKKISTSLIDEFVLKPIEDNLFKGLNALFGMDKPIDPQAQVAANTQQTVSEVQKVSNGLTSVTTAIQNGTNRIEAAIRELVSPTGTPLAYPTPAQISTTASPGAYPAGGSLATFGETGRVFNKMPGWIHGHLQPVAGKGTMEDLVNDGVAMAKALIAQGVESYFGNGSQEVRMKSGMSDDQIRAGVRKAISQHKGQNAVDIWVPTGTRVPMPLYDIQASSGNEGVNGLMPGGKTFMGHLTPDSAANKPFPQVATPVPAATSSGAGASALAKYDPNTQALLKTIMFAEGTLKPGRTVEDAFRTNFGGSLFSSFSKHPGTYVAGAYQMKPDTFGESARRLGLRDFSPESQTAAILDQIRRRGVDPSQPLTTRAINDLSGLFATFPTAQGVSAYGQGFKPANVLMNQYKGFLGSPAISPTTNPASVTSVDTRPVVQLARPATEALTQSAASISPAFKEAAAAATALTQGLRSLADMPGIRNPASVKGSGAIPIPVQRFGETVADVQEVDMTSVTDAAAGAAASLRRVQQSSAQTPQAMAGLNSALGSVMQGLGGIGMGLAGVSQMGQGGTQNTLLGLAGIFGGISSIAGMFAPGGGLAGLFGGGGAGSAVGGLFGAAGGLFRAKGGPISANNPYIVGEEGPELIFPGMSGRVMNANDTERYVSNLRRFMSATAGANRYGLNQASEEDFPMLPGFQQRKLSNSESKALALDAQRTAISAYQEGDVEEYMKYASFARQYGPSLYGKDGRLMRGGADTVFEQTGGADKSDSSASTLTVRYESQVINNVEYVTVDQMRVATREAAERGRSMALNSLQNSVRTRKRVGI